MVAQPARGRPRSAPRGRRRRPILPAQFRPPFAVYRLRVRLLPTAIGAQLSLLHPEVRILVENRMEVGPGDLLLEGRIFGPGAGLKAPDWELQLGSAPETSEVDLRPDGPDAVHFRFTQQVPRLHEVVRRHRLLTRYPLVIQNGVMRFETVATAPQVRAVVAELRQRVGDTEVEAIRHGRVTLGSLGLGPAQETVFRAAMNGGYFDLPRGTSVTGLADQLGLSKSAVSETLTRIEKRLAEAALQLSLV